MHGVCLINDYSETLVDNRYRVGTMIGLGGTGAVYRAEDVRVKQPVAIKFLPINNAEAAARFRHEAQATSLIESSNIVSVYDFGETPQGELFLVMELLEGENLRVLQKGVMEARRALEIARQVCSALRVAHGAGIVHRDLKPDNIFLVDREDKSVFVKVLDFGIAKVMEGGILVVEETPTPGGLVCGTPSYMAPEQVTDQAIEPRTDFYALGVILFQLFTGERLFEGETIKELMISHAREAPRKLREVVPELGYSSALEDILLKCLEKDPKNRFENADALRARIEQFLRGELPIFEEERAPQGHP